MARMIWPQWLISTFAIVAYVRAGMFPANGVAMHLCSIALLQALFFGIWSRIAVLDAGAWRNWIRQGFAISLFLKAVFLNLVYLASYATFQLWHAYLTWDNVKGSAQHFEGFYQTFGWVIPASLLGLGLVLLLLWWFANRLAPRLLRDINRLQEASHHGRYTTTLVALLGACLSGLWLREPNTAHIAPKDPFLAFWLSSSALDSTPTPDMLAQRQAADFAPTKNFRPRNVIIITVDCLRRDHLPFHGYARETSPFLTDLVATNKARFVKVAVSNGNYSAQGKLSVLGSRLPNRQQFFDFKIHDALKRLGYRTHLIAAGDNTNLQNMRKHYGPNLDIFYDGVSPGAFGMNDDRRIIQRLNQLPPSDGTPAFFYFHLMSAHSLGLKLPEYQRWQPSALILDIIPMITGRYEPVLMVNTYDNGILQSDRYIEQIFSILKAKGYLNDYVGVLTGDHGEGLGERGIFGHFGYTYMEDIGIPILFFESESIDYGPLPLGSQIDIAPTLLDRLGLIAPRQWEGQSLFRSPPPAAVYSECFRNAENWQTTIMERRKSLFKYFLIRPLNGDSREMLFNLSVDPGEHSNLSAEPEFSDLLLEMRSMNEKRFSHSRPAVD